MPLIGRFTTTPNGFSGRVKTLFMEAELTISQLTKPLGANPPDFIITLGKDSNGPVVGSARKKISESGNDYISIRIDDPSLVNPICGGLFPDQQSSNQYYFYWSRPHKLEEKK